MNTLVVTFTKLNPPFSDVRLIMELFDSFGVNNMRYFQQDGTLAGEFTSNNSVEVQQILVSEIKPAITSSFTIRIK